MEPITTLPSEIVYLGWSVVLLIAHILIQGGSVTLEVGLPYAATSRDEGRQAKGVFAGRAERNLHNFLETYPAFVALALGLAVTGQTGGTGATGAALWFWARIVYAPLYLFGVPYLRTLAWAVSLVGLVLMLLELLS